MTIDVIRLAREAGAYGTEDALGNAIVLFDWAELERFAALVAAAEREECAKECDDVSLQAMTSWKLAYQLQDQGREMGAEDCAAAIRARKP